RRRERTSREAEQQSDAKSPVHQLSLLFSAEVFSTESAQDYKASLRPCRLPAPLSKFRTHLFGMRRLNLLKNLKRCFSVSYSLCAVTKAVECHADVEKCSSFTDTVA